MLIGILGLFSAYAPAQVCTNTPMGHFIRSLYRDILVTRARDATRTTPAQRSTTKLGKSFLSK